jgi:hypothetical protein
MERVYGIPGSSQMHRRRPRFGFAPGSNGLLERSRHHHIRTPLQAVPVLSHPVHRKCIVKMQCKGFEHCGTALTLLFDLVVVMRFLPPLIWVRVEQLKHCINDIEQQTNRNLCREVS